MTSQAQRFCTTCGEPMPEPVGAFCSKCGEPVSGDLSTQAKKRIEDEERAREKVRVESRAEAEARDSKPQAQKKAKGCLRPLLIIFIVLIGTISCTAIVAVFSDTPAASTESPSASSSTENTASQTSTLESKWGIKNEMRAVKICREFNQMLTAVSDGTENYTESRERMKEMSDMAAPDIASSLRTPVRTMLSAWTQNDLDRFLSAAEEIAPVCVDVFKAN